MSKISVIIPTWNRAGTIKQAIDSVLNQTLSPLEILICDDGSQDYTEEIIKSINDPRVIWLPGPRGGRPAIPRNRGIAASKGEWLAFLDSDDEWVPDKLEKQLASAQKTNCRAACSNAHRFIPGKGIQGTFFTLQKEIFNFADLLKTNRVICSSSLVHCSLFKTTAGFPEDPALKALEDYALWLRIASFTPWCYVSDPLVIYRDDAANSVRKDDPDVWVQRKIVLNNYLKWAESQKKTASIAQNDIRAAKKTFFITKCLRPFHKS